MAGQPRGRLIDSDRDQLPRRPFRRARRARRHRRRPAGYPSSQPLAPTCSAAPAARPRRWRPMTKRSRSPRRRRAWRRPKPSADGTGEGPDEQMDRRTRRRTGPAPAPDTASPSCSPPRRLHRRPGRDRQPPDRARPQHSEPAVKPDSQRCHGPPVPPRSRPPCVRQQLPSPATSRPQAPAHVPNPGQHASGMASVSAAQKPINDQPRAGRTGPRMAHRTQPTVCGVAMPLLHQISGLVKDTGTANTVVVCHGRLLGENTDVHGMLHALHEAGVTCPRSVTILGAGASARSPGLCEGWPGRAR
jgi:hypothetical protein